MTKSQITLVLGFVSIIAPCVPCVGSMLYMVCLVGTMVVGVMAHVDEEIDDQILAKVGMGVSTIPVVAMVLFFIGYFLLLAAMMVLTILIEVVN